MRIAARIAAASLPDLERGKLTALLMALADLPLAHGQLLEALRRHPVIDEITRQSALAEEFIAEGERRGEKRGERQGKQQLAQALLERHFGSPLTEEMVAALRQADEATLIQLLAQLATLTLDQARELLGLH